MKSKKHKLAVSKITVSNLSVAKKQQLLGGGSRPCLIQNEVSPDCMHSDTTNCNAY
jgi:hypothetical protein